MRYLLHLLLSSLFVCGQIGPMRIIDSTSASTGTSQLRIADLNQDSKPDVAASFTGSNGQLGFYENLGNNSFAALTVVDSLPFCKGVAVGDFDQNGHPDLVAIGGIHMEARLYFNNTGIFGAPVSLDSNISTQMNDVAVEDFDGNGSPDMVIIGQHSIDFYRNDGSGQFNKEVILTTSTSPRSLECLDLATADVDQDGDIDLICGETAGLVVYTNSGNGQFTPHYYSTTPEIGFVVHPIDINGDGAIDVVMRISSGDVKWFSNDGNGNLSFEAVLPALPSVYNMKSIDYNQDGQLDLYVSYLFNVSVFLNDSAYSFTNEVSVHQSNNLIMGPIAIANIDDHNAPDYLWAGVINTIAYHPNQNGLGVPNYTIRNNQAPYPNPTHRVLYFQNPVARAMICNQQGQILRSFENVQQIDLSGLPAGMYCISINDQRFGMTEIHRVVKF